MFFLILKLKFSLQSRNKLIIITVEKHQFTNSIRYNFYRVKIFVKKNSNCSKINSETQTTFFNSIHCSYWMLGFTDGLIKKRYKNLRRPIADLRIKSVFSIVFFVLLSLNGFLSLGAFFALSVLFYLQIIKFIIQPVIINLK